MPPVEDVPFLLRIAFVPALSVADSVSVKDVPEVISAFAVSVSP